MNTVNYRGVQQNNTAGCASPVLTISVKPSVCPDCGGGMTRKHDPMSSLDIGPDFINVRGRSAWQECSWCSDRRTKALQEKLQAMGYDGPPPLPLPNVTGGHIASQPCCTCGTCPVHGR